MPRKSSSAAPADLREDIDLDTAERARPKQVHTPMHEARGSESDARNTPRLSAADYEWRPPTNLDAPEPRPGYVQRWVRSEFRSEADNLNWTAKLREGWRPRDPKTVSESEYYFGEGSKNGVDVIRVGGMILMEAPLQLVQKKRQAINEQTRRQEQSVSMETDRASREGVAEGYAPIRREHTTRVSTGRRPSTLAD